MNITRAQWLSAVVLAALVHGLFVAAFFFSGFERREPVQAPEGVMVSLDSLDAGPPPQAAAPEAPVDAPAPRPEAASAPPAAQATPAESIASPIPEAPQPPASVGPVPAQTAAAPAQAAPATPVEPTIESMPAVEPSLEPVSAVAVAPIDASEAIEPSEQIVARAPEVVPTETREPDSDANGASGSSQESTDDYIVRLRAWLARHKEYPQAARQTEIQGTVRLYLVVDQAGNVRELRITQSSGSALLDRAAQQMVERAEPLPRMPATMQRNRLELIVPIVFSLR